MTPRAAKIKVRLMRLLRDMSEYSEPCDICKSYACAEKAMTASAKAIPTPQIACGDTGFGTLPSNCPALWLGRFEESKNISSGAISCESFLDLRNQSIRSLKQNEYARA